MVAQLEAVFRAFDEVTRATAEERDELEGLRDGVVATLLDSGAIVSAVDAGSYRRGTEVGGSSHWDVVAVLAPARRVSLAQALDALRDAIAVAVPDVVPVNGAATAAGATVVAGADSLLVRRSSSDATGVRLIPAIESGTRAASDTVLLPDAARRWVAARPAARDALFDRIDADGSLRRLVRLVLAWKHRFAVPLSSYWLETAVLRQALQQRSFDPLWDLCWIFEQAVDDDLSAIPDPTSPSGRQPVRPAPTLARRIELQYVVEAAARRVRDAVNAYLDDDTEAVTSALRDVLGQDIPPVTV
ncbi:hypothetical protein ACFJGV_08005 [Cnuibacter sp. UC19_7]|uniref:hypothetical protein n=1 Tax=Cnuibacter sp. UC19_7 TaxID=3350166 RepID=UPI00366EE96A